MANINSDLSALESTVIIAFELLHGDIDLILQKNISKEEKTYLKYLKTYIMKYAMAAGKRLDYEAQKKLKSKYKNYELAIEPRNIGKNFRVSLSNDDYLYLVEEVLEHNCNGCKGNGHDNIRDKKHCRVHKILMDTFVPELNKPSEGFPCEYCHGKVALKKNYRFHISTKKYAEIHKLDDPKDDIEAVLVYSDDSQYSLYDLNGEKYPKKKMSNVVFDTIRECILYATCRSKCLPINVIKVEVEESQW